MAGPWKKMADLDSPASNCVNNACNYDIALSADGEWCPQSDALLLSSSTELVGKEGFEPPTKCV